jgi:DNA modification methylase
VKSASGESFEIYNDDCVAVLAGLADDSVDFAVYSPPFESIYSYSDDPRDMSNCDSSAAFFEHYGFMVRELYRVMKPGRNVSFHCMALPYSKQRDGVIGLRDFPGDLLRAHQAVGFIGHSHHAIWKDPVVAMTRTKALGLLWKQIRKDSVMSRMGIMDQVWTVRKPGDNAVPVTHTKESFPVAQWQKWASPVWDDIDQSDVLPCRAGKAEGDQKHLCPLQLDVIRRCIRLWSNPGELVLSPFTGVGSEGHVALHESRRFIGAELKASYFKQAVLNLRAAEERTADLFAV